MFDGVYHTITPAWTGFPWSISPQLEYSSSVGAEKGRCWKLFRRQLSEDVSFGIGTLLVVEQSTLEDRPRGVIVLYTPSYAALVDTRCGNSGLKNGQIGTSRLY